VKRVFGHSDAIYCLVVDPLSRILVIASDDFLTKVWTIPELDPVIRFSGHEAEVTNIALNASCTIVLSSSNDKTIRLFSLKHGKCLSVLAEFMSDIVNYTTFSPTGSMIAAGCEDGTIPLWTTRDALQSLPPLRVIPSPELAITWLCFSPGGEFLAYAAEASSLAVTALKTMQRSILECHQGQVDFLQFSQDFVSLGGGLSPRLLTVSNEDGSLAVWQIENNTWKVRHQFRHVPGPNRRSTKIAKVGWDRSEHLIVIAKTNGVYVCDTLSGETAAQLPPAAGAFENCQIAIGRPIRPEIFLLANNTGNVCLLDVLEQQILCEFAMENSRPFADGVWAKDGEVSFLTDAIGSITIFQCGKARTWAESIDVFTSTEKGIAGEFFYCDRSGRPLRPQPCVVDIRRLSLPIELTQNPFLRHCAAELVLTQRMSARGDRTAAVQPGQAAVGPPPLHIRLAVEAPVNPHGSIVIPPSDDQPDDTPGSESAQIDSEQDDWCFDDRAIDPSGGTPPFLRTRDAADGIWPEWATAVSCDDAVFIPQVCDEVVICKKAYLRQLAVTHDTVPDNLPDAFRALVLSITPHDRGILLALGEATEERRQIEVIYPVFGAISFVVSRGRWLSVTNWLPHLIAGDTVAVRRLDADGTLTTHTGRVTAVADDCIADPDLSISVDWGDETGSISPWEVIARNGEAIAVPDSSTIILQYITEFVAALGKVIDDRKNDRVIHLPTDKAKVEYPCSLYMIRERIESAWYRKFQAIVADLKLALRTNMAVFGAEAPEVDQTRKICATLTELLQKIVQAAKSRRHER
jgi:WD40 repeat protein